jgi:UDP-N-acetylglucosamine 1-carboxyvinyltransferase
MWYHAEGTVKMSDWLVRGGAVLEGTVSVQGSKNAALPILAATLLTEEPVTLLNCPAIRDAENMLGILASLGCTVKREADAVTVDSSTASGYVLPTALSGELRSSIFLLGSVLARFHAADAPYPGGCEIGNRPIDLHLFGLKRLNAEIEERGGRICCKGHNLTGAVVDLEYPSVGATENIMLAAQSLGLGTCCLGAPTRFLNSAPEAQPYREKLGINPDYQILYMIAVGYPDEEPAAKPRDLSKIRFVE